MKDHVARRHDDRLLALAYPLVLAPTARDLAEDADVREEFRRRTGGPLPRAMRGDAADLGFLATFPPLYSDHADHGPASASRSSGRDLPAPAGCGAHALPHPSPSLTAVPPGRGSFDDLHALQGRRPDQVAGTWAALRLLLLGAAAFYLLASLGLALAALAGLFTNDT